MVEKQTTEISQLHRIVGQLAGIEKMITEGKKTSEVIQQIEAVCGSLKSLEKKLLKNSLKGIKDVELKKSIDLALRT